MAKDPKTRETEFRDAAKEALKSLGVGVTSVDFISTRPTEPPLVSVAYKSNYFLTLSSNSIRNVYDLAHQLLSRVSDPGKRLTTTFSTIDASCMTEEELSELRVLHRCAREAGYALSRLG